MIAGVLRDLRGPLILSSIAALGWQGVVLLVPLVLGWVVTEAIENGRVGAAWWGVVLILALALAEAAFDAWRHRLENGASADGAGRLRRSVLRGVLAGNVPDDIDPGDIVARGTDDADVVAALLDSLGYTIAYALSVPIAIVLLVAIDPILAVLCVVALAIGIPLTRLAAAPLGPRSDAFQEAAAAAVSEVQAVLPSRRAAVGLGVNVALVDRYARRSARMGSAASAVAAIGVRSAPIGALASAASVVAVLAWGGSAVAEGSLGLGALTAAIGLALYIAGPLEAVVDQLLELSVARASARRISAVASTTDLLERRPGNLVMRHDPTFWTDALRQNLALGRDFDDGALQSALDAAELSDVHWAEGLDTVLAEAGGHLSGGQRQRLALARALLHADSIEVGDGLDGVGPAQRARLVGSLGVRARD